MNLGRAIRLCRGQRGMNQAEVAERAEISVSYLSLIEHGKRDPNLSTIERIAQALRVPTSVLVFLAADAEELEELGREAIEKLSVSALMLMKSKA